jgi:hypothetical protein
LALVSKLSTGLRRALIGQPFRSDKLAHTLLPKRIALPVFASDAMSSVAYAPEEIFLVLSVAGRGLAARRVLDVRRETRHQERRQLPPRLFDRASNPGADRWMIINNQDSWL